MPNYCAVAIVVELEGFGPTAVASSTIARAITVASWPTVVIAARTSEDSTAEASSSAIVACTFVVLASFGKL